MCCGGDAMRQIDDARIRRRGYYRGHLPGVGIVRAEVGQQRNQAVHVRAAGSP